MKRNPQIPVEKLYQLLHEVCLKAGWKHWESKDRIAEWCRQLVENHLDWPNKQADVYLRRFRKLVLKNYRINPLASLSVSRELLLKLTAYLDLCDEAGFEAYLRTISVPGNVPVSKQFHHIHAIILQKDLNELNNTYWLVYRRVEGRTGVLQTNLLCIFPPNRKQFNVAKLILGTPAEDNYDYIGVATADQANQHLICLFIEDRARPNTQLYMHLIVRLTPDHDRQQLAVGHLTYISPKLKKLITKTAVLSRLQARSEAEAHQLFNQIGQQVPDPVETFLRDRNLNRLTSPNLLIENMNDLENFLKDQRQRGANLRLEKFEGDYHLHYGYEDETGTLQLSSERLSIRQDTYHHIAATLYLKGSNEHDREFAGEIHTNSPFVSFYFKREQSGNEQTVYLKLKMPGPDYAGSFECTTGVLSSSDKPNNNLKSYVALVVKTGLEGYDPASDARVRRFFERLDHKGRLRVPHLDHFRLSELDKIG